MFEKAILIFFKDETPNKSHGPVLNGNLFLKDIQRVHVLLHIGNTCEACHAKYN